MVGDGDGGSGRRERAATRGERAGTGGALGVRSQGPRAPPPGGAVSMATAGTRARGPERGPARPRGDPRGTGRFGRRHRRDSATGRAPPLSPPPVPPRPPGALPRSSRSLPREAKRRSRALGTGLIALPARCPRCCCWWWCWRCSASRRQSPELGGHRPRAAPGPAPGRAPRSRLRSSAELSRVCPAPGHRERQRGPGTPIRWVTPGRTELGRGRESAARCGHAALRGSGGGGDAPGG